MLTGLYCLVKFGFRYLIWFQCKQLSIGIFLYIPLNQCLLFHIVLCIQTPNQSYKYIYIYGNRTRLNNQYINQMRYLIYKLDKVSGIGTQIRKNISNINLLIRENIWDINHTPTKMFSLIISSTKSNKIQVTKFNKWSQDSRNQTIIINHSQQLKQMIAL